jgi:Insertion element 4 transposase N-terminal
MRGGPHKPRTVAEFPKGTPLRDYIRLGVLATTFPLLQVKAVLTEQTKLSRRKRELAAHVVVCYVIALGLLVQVSYREALRCVLEEWA